MAFANSAAGVYDREIDLSFRGGSVTSSHGAIIVESGRGIPFTVVPVTEKKELTSKFGEKNFAKYGPSMFCAEQFLQESSYLNVVRVVDRETALTAGAYLTVDDINAPNPVIKLTNWDDSTHRPKGKKGDILKEVGFVKGNHGVSSTPFYICAISPGSWAKEITVQVRPSAPTGTQHDQVISAYLFHIDVFINYKGPTDLPVESFLCSRKYELDGEGQQLFIEDRVNNQSEYIRVKNNPHCEPVRIVTSAIEILDGGADGDRVVNETINEAWGLVSDTESISAQILIAAGYSAPRVAQRMVSVARARGDAMAILDIPRELQTAVRAINYRRNTLSVNDSYGALYAPFLKVRDTGTNKDIWIPPSGAVAGAFAYTDRVKAYYWAPAGLRRGGISCLDIEHKYSFGDLQALDAAQVNVIRKIPKRGFVIMGQSTLQNFDSSFSNVNVRRLVNGIKSTIRRAIIVGLFNPNDDYERLRLKTIAEGVVEPVKNDRGVNEYEAVCDLRNNKAAQINNGDLVLDVVLDPSIPAKRVHLGADIRSFGASISFTEG